MDNSNPIYRGLEAMGNGPFNQALNQAPNLGAQKIKQAAPASIALEIHEKQLHGLRITIEALLDRLGPLMNSKSATGAVAGEGPSTGGSEIVLTIDRLTGQVATLEQQLRGAIERLEI